MRDRGRLSRLLVASCAAAACLAVVAMLWQLRPVLPSGAALSSVFVGELLRLLLWGTVFVLALVLLARAVRAGTRRASAVAPVRAARRPGVRRHPLLDARAAEGAPLCEAEGYVPSWRQPKLTLSSFGQSAPSPLSAVAATERSLEPAIDAVAYSTESVRVAVLVLGPLEIPSDGRRRRRAPGPAHELIAYLALHPAGATRDELLEALWPHQSPSRSEQRFWQASKEARKLLDGCIVRDSGRYRLDREQVDVDADRLERLLARADKATDEIVEDELLEQALTLFRGEPLAGCDFRWAEGPLRRLSVRRLELLDRIARARLANGDTRGALDAAEQGIAADELNEGFWRLALKAEAATGSRDGISRRYDDLARRLDERLGLKPSSETRVLYLRLLGPDSD